MPTLAYMLAIIAPRAQTGLGPGREPHAFSPIDFETSRIIFTSEGGWCPSGVIEKAALDPRSVLT